MLFPTCLIYQILAGFVWSGKTKEFVLQTRQSLATCKYKGSRANLMLERNNSSTPRPKWIVSAWQWCDWEIMTLAVEMRPGASPHNGLCWIRKLQELSVQRRGGACHLFDTGICVGWSLSKSIRQWSYSIHCLKVRINYVGYVFQIPNHMSARCQSWSYNLIYDIVRLWPDSYQKRNLWRPQLHQQDNLWDSWQSLPCTFI